MENKNEHYVREIETLFDYDDLLNDSFKNLVVIKFTAKWCGPCRHLINPIRQLSVEYRDIIFAEADIDNTNINVLKIFQEVTRVPTLVFIKDYNIIYQFSGASVDKLKSTIKEYLAGNLTKKDEIKQVEQQKDEQKDDCCKKNE